MFNATKIRLYPTLEQRKKLSHQFGCTRWVFNWGLELSQKAYLETGKGLTYRQLQNQLPQLKKQNEWLEDADSQALQCSLQNLAAAYENFFRGRAKYPRFRQKHGPQSYAYPQRFRIVERRENRWGSVYMPKVGEVRARIHRETEGRIKTVTISLDCAGRYWASVLTDNEAPLPHVSIDGLAVGVDLGINHFAVLSTGRKVKNPRHLERAERNLKRKQKSLSRKQIGSCRRQKARLLVAHAHEKIRHARADFLHKESRKLVNESQVICFESLNIKGMVRNHKLAKAISDCAWSTYIRFSQYKAEKEGKAFVKCHRFYPSSKTCSGCGHILGKLPLSIRSWDCPRCLTHHDRDENASNNIRDEGLRILWAEGYPAPVSGGRVRRTALASDALPCEARSLVSRTG